MFCIGVEEYSNMWYPDKDFGRQERWLSVLLSLPQAVVTLFVRKLLASGKG
jgi:hypothetical protein